MRSRLYMDGLNSRSPRSCNFVGRKLFRRDAVFFWILRPWRKSSILPFLPLLFQLIIKGLMTWARSRKKCSKQFWPIFQRPNTLCLDSTQKKVHSQRTKSSGLWAPFNMLYNGHCLIFFFQSYECLLRLISASYWGTSRTEFVVLHLPDICVLSNGRARKKLFADLRRLSSGEESMAYMISLLPSTSSRRWALDFIIITVSYSLYCWGRHREINFVWLRYFTPPRLLHDS